MIKKYTPEKIKEILTEGSVRDKATLFLRDRMGYFQFDLHFILNFGEPEELMNSIAPHELREWNEYISMGLRIENAFRDLHRFMFIASDSRGEMIKLLSFLTDLEEMEDLLNETLLTGTLHNSLDPNVAPDLETIHKLRFSTARHSLLNRTFSHLKPVLSDVGDIDINLRGTTIEEDDRFKTLKEKVDDKWWETEMWMRNVLLFIEALRRRFKMMDLILPEYEHLISQYMNVLDSPLAGHLRFEGVQDNRLFYLGDYDKTSADIFTPYPAMREIIEDYSLRISEVDPKLDENEDTITRYFNSI